MIYNKIINSIIFVIMELIVESNNSLVYQAIGFKNIKTTDNTTEVFEYNGLGYVIINHELNCIRAIPTPIPIIGCTLHAILKIIMILASTHSIQLDLMQIKR